MCDCNYLEKEVEKLREQLFAEQEAHRNAKINEAAMRSVLMIYRHAGTQPTIQKPFKNYNE